MVKLADLHRGDKVKIVDEWGGNIGQNNQGLMDKWLGKTMTIDSIHDSYACMLEDVGDPPGWGRWAWYERMIDYVIPVYEPPKMSEEDILSMLFN